MKNENIKNEKTEQYLNKYSSQKIDRAIISKSTKWYGKFPMV